MPDTKIGQLYTWEKDRHFRYIKCNEIYAAAAGLDSPYSIIGKTDDEMPWRSLADNFRAGDQSVIDGNTGRILIQEKEIMVNRTADILVTEKQLVTSADQCIGVIGYFIDITGHQLVRTNTDQYFADERHLYLGKEFDNEYLTRTEARILEKAISGWTCSKIALVFNKSERTVENHINNLKRKLQCKTKADLTSVVQSAGLHWRLSDWVLQ